VSSAVPVSLGCEPKTIRELRGAKADGIVVEREPCEGPCISTGTLVVRLLTRPAAYLSSNLYIDEGADPCDRPVSPEDGVVGLLVKFQNVFITCDPPSIRA
jgi:hypothetical protein